MDALVEKLGYMDYRDALACNKYILEAKRSADYHSQVRARVLQTAFSLLQTQKREELEKAAHRAASASAA
jgi:hypothetical protein